MVELLRIGIIGAGGVARSIHLPGLRLCPQVEITAVCDPDLAAAGSLGISRTFSISEGKTIQFRAESFNLPNHTNPNPPVSALNNTTAFGKIQSAGDPRILQFGLKVVF